MSTYLVTGTSRGIGLEMVKQLTANTTKIKTIVAVTRNKDSQALNDIISQSQGRVVNVIIPDITDEQVIQKALPELERALPNGLDVLINNAGASDYHPNGLNNAKAADLTKLFVTNVASVQAVTSTLFPLLQQGSSKKIINIATTLGSIGSVERYAFFPGHGYKVSKSALNMLTKLWSLEFAKAGFTVMGISPGWLKTDLGSEHADLTVDVGVEQVLKIVDEATTANNGEYRNIKVAGWENNGGMNFYDGELIPY